MIITIIVLILINILVIHAIFMNIKILKLYRHHTKTLEEMTSLHTMQMSCRNTDFNEYANQQKIIRVDLNKVMRIVFNQYEKERINNEQT